MSCKQRRLLFSDVYKVVNFNAPTNSASDVARVESSTLFVVIWHMSVEFGSDWAGGNSRQYVW
jgi:hypothetical protein